MTALLLGALWACLVAQFGFARTAARRLPEPAQHPAGCVRRRGIGPAVRALPTQVGAPCRRLLGRSAQRCSDRQVGLAVLTGLMVVAIQPELAPLPLLAVIAFSHLDDRRRARRHERAVVDQLPDVVDLLRLTTLAGLPVSAAVTAIGSRPGGQMGRCLSGAALLLARGSTTSQALDALAEGGGRPVRNLVDALLDHDRYGTPLAPALDRVALECRLQRRRQAEEEARRLPVTLLFPLVLTTLPAFALLTIAPLLAGSLAELRL